MPLKDIIRSKVSVIEANASLKDAAEKMYKDHVGSIVIIDKTKSTKGKPVGILTDRDVAIALGTSKKLERKKTVKDFMTKNMIMCSVDDGLYDAISIMKTNGIRRVPVVDSHNDLAGVICADDVLQILSKELNALSILINNEAEREKKEKVSKSPLSGKQLQAR